MPDTTAAASDDGPPEGIAWTSESDASVKRDANSGDDASDPTDYGHTNRDTMDRAVEWMTDASTTMAYLCDHNIEHHGQWKKWTEKADVLLLDLDFCLDNLRRDILDARLFDHEGGGDFEGTVGSTLRACREYTQMQNDDSYRWHQNKGLGWPQYALARANAILESLRHYRDNPPE